MFKAVAAIGRGFVALLRDVEFRPGKVIGVLVAALPVWVLVLVAFGFVFAPTLLLLSLLESVRIFFETNPVLIFSGFALALLAFVAQLIAWFSERQELRESEHLFLLVLFGFYGAVNFGAVFFVVQHHSPPPFRVNNDLAAHYRESLSAPLREGVARSQLTEEWIKTIAARLSTGGTLSAKPRSFSKKIREFTTGAEYELITPLSDVRFTYAVRDPRGLVPDGNRIITVESNGRKIEVNPFRHGRACWLDISPENFPAESLRKALLARADWEEQQVQRPREDQLARLAGQNVLSPPTVMYETVMTMLGASQKYLEPQTTLGRVLFLCFHLFKYLYFTMTIGFLARNLPKSAAAKAGS